jgi:hypothetical protein
MLKLEDSELELKVGMEISARIGRGVAPLYKDLRI